MYFHYVAIISLTMDMALHLNKLESLTLECFISSMVELESVILKKLMNGHLDRQLTNKQRIFCKA